MASYDFDIGVIGGGAAGLTVTSCAAQQTRCGNVFLSKNILRQD